MEYEDELNHRLERRWLPSTSLKPLFDARPCPTKYTWFQTIDETPKAKEPLRQYSEYSTKVFNPGNRAPVDYYMKSVDVESKLRSQFMALQKGDQAVFIPELSSDLYTVAGGTKVKEYTPIEGVKTRQIPPHLEPFSFGNMTRLHVKK
jgi:hypothetical protein